MITRASKNASPPLELGNRSLKDKYNTCMTHTTAKKLEHKIDVKRTPAGWLFETLEDEGEIEVPCLETKLTLKQVFAGVEFEARAVKSGAESDS